MFRCHSLPSRTPLTPPFRIPKIELSRPHRKPPCHKLAPSTQLGTSSSGSDFRQHHSASTTGTSTTGTLNDIFMLVQSFQLGLCNEMRSCLPPARNEPEVIVHCLERCVLFRSLWDVRIGMYLNTTFKSFLGSAGILMAGMEARIMRDDGTDADINEPGELWLRGDNVALGYWNNEKATKETFVDGWLHTGDKFRADSDGNFWYADRAKDILKVSGAQVSPVEIENCLLKHPGNLINDVTVAGVSGGRISDEKVPRAWIVLTPAGKKRGVAAVVKELDAWHKKNSSKYKWLRGGIQVVDRIPKSPTGKVLRRVLQDRYEANAKQLNTKL